MTPAVPAAAKIHAIRISFIQIESISGPLQATKTPAIPFSFLLSGPMFQEQYNTAANNGGSLQIPWSHGYGKLFWQFYVRNNAKGVKDYWRAVIPLEFRVEAAAKAAWLKGEVRLRAYLYPWGIGVVADIRTELHADLVAATTEAVQIRKAQRFQVEIDKISRDLNLEGMLAFVRERVRAAAYGPSMATGQPGDIFSIATVTDGEGVDPDTPVSQAGDLHKSLVRLTTWNPLLSPQLGPIGESCLHVKGGSAGHVLFAARRGRTVWFPGHFESVADYKPRLACYHQNLTMASLQTEALCRMVKDAAEQIQANTPPTSLSVAYSDCSQFAAGILGRLFGPNNYDIYRSFSVRSQIADTYKDDVNSVRRKFNQPDLQDKQAPTST
jgi:hypothetical protein